MQKDIQKIINSSPISKHTIVERRLNSGARLVHINMPNITTSAVAIWLRAGSRFDPEGKEGLSHFFEHLLLGKTKQYTDPIERMRDLEKNGIYQNAYTNQEDVYYLSEQFASQTYDGLGSLLDGVFGAVITDEIIEKEKEVILDEGSSERNDPEEYIHILKSEAVWPDSPLSTSVLGTPKSVNSINKNDIEDFKEKYYVPENVIFLVISPDSTEKIQDYIENKYSPVATTLKFSEETFKSPEKLKIEKRSLDRVKVSISFRTTSAKNEKDTNDLHLFLKYLSNGWTSKLVEELRTRHNLTYWVNGHMASFYDTGGISFTFSVNRKNINKALDLIAKNIQAIKTDLIPEKELTGHKIYYVSSLIRGHTDPADFLTWYGNDAASQIELCDLASYTKDIFAVSPKDIRDVAQKYIKEENMSITAIGDVTENDFEIPKI